MKFFSLATILMLFQLVFILGCGGGTHENPATEKLSSRDKMYYEQYMVQGQALYKQHCINCHKEDGSG